MRIPLTAAALTLPLVVLASCSFSGGDDGNESDKNNASDDVPEVATTTTWPYDKSTDEAKVKVHKLKVRDKLMHLTLTVKAPEPQDTSLSINDDYGSPHDLFDGLAPSLVDTDKLNRHEVLDDSNGSRMGADDVDTKLTYGEPEELTYVFAAPSKKVTSMDLYVNEFPPVTDLPIER